MKKERENVRFRREKGEKAGGFGKLYYDSERRNAGLREVKSEEIKNDVKKEAGTH